MSREPLGICCGSDWQAEIIGDLDFAERKFMADLSSCSFAGSDAGEQALRRDLSAAWLLRGARGVSAELHQASGIHSGEPGEGGTGREARGVPLLFHVRGKR